MAGLVRRWILAALESRERPSVLHHRGRSLRGCRDDEWTVVDALATTSPLHPTGAVKRVRPGWLRCRERWPASSPRTGRVLDRARRARHSELDTAARPGHVSDPRTTTCRARSDRGSRTD